MGIASKALRKKAMSWDDAFTASRDEAKAATLDTIVKDVDPFVPYKTGALCKSVYKDVPTSTIGYSAPYASYAFNPISASGKPKRYTKTVHPLARGNPIDHAEKLYRFKWADVFRKEMLARAVRRIRKSVE